MAAVFISEVRNATLTLDNSVRISLAHRVSIIAAGHRRKVEGRMSYRKLRIAFSALCGIICVLLFVLLVRSYWWADQIYGHMSATRVMHFGSMRGQVTLRRVIYDGPGIPKNWLPDSELVSDILNRRQLKFPNGQDDLVVYHFNSRSGFGLLHDGVYIPHWILVAIFGLVAIAPWIRSMRDSAFAHC
jgi:hypothetical protein